MIFVIFCLPCSLTRRVNGVLVGGVCLSSARGTDEGTEEDPIGPVERAQRGTGEAQVRDQEGGQ